MTTAYLALGSNLGNRGGNLRMALRAVTRMCRIVNASSLYESPAEGPPQPSYLNAVCSVETGLEPAPLLRFLKGIEEEIGRRPGEVEGGSRPVDLDIILYDDDRVVDEPGLVIPHPRALERAFVMVPFAEVAPDLRFPGTGKTVAEIARGLPGEGIKIFAHPGWDGVAGREAGRIRV